MNPRSPNGPSPALQRKIAAVERSLRRSLGTPRLELTRETPLDILVATILSQNTNDVNSHKAWMNLKRTFPRWDDVLSAPIARVAKAIEVGGLKNQKAKAIRTLLRSLKRERGKYSLAYLRSMSDRQALEHLQRYSGVGSKTAACVLVFGLGREVFPVDTHIHRILNRLGIVRTATPDKTFEAMEQLSPRNRAYAFHINLIRFGRETCQARSPRCGECILYDLCEFPSKEQFLHQAKNQRESTEGRDFIILHNLRRIPSGRPVDSARKKP